MKYTAIIREKGTNYYVKRTDSDYTSKSQYAKDCRANGYYVGGIFTDAEIDLIVNGFQSNDIDTWKKSMEFRNKFSERIISCFTDGTLDISEPEQAEEKPEEAAMVRDEYGNEIFVGETIGECQEYCKMHGITGGNGEYIGIGFFTKDRYFEMEDTQEIESYGNWFNDVFLPSLFERAEPLKSIYLTQKQTAVCIRNMEYHCTKDCNGSHEWYTCTWRGRSVELSYSKKNQCGSIRFGRDAEEQEAADKKAMEEQKAQKEELFQIKLEAIRSGNQRTIDAVLRRYQILKERKADMMQDIADGFYTEQEDVYVKNEEELAWISELVKEARKAKQVKETSNHENAHNFMRECTLIEIVMKETTKNTEARQPKGRPPPIKQFYQSNFIKKEVRTWH
jgi:hypothetical protein